jgi:hypothetical protein
VDFRSDEQLHLLSSCLHSFYSELPAALLSKRTAIVAELRNYRRHHHIACPSNAEVEETEAAPSTNIYLVLQSRIWSATECYPATLTELILPLMAFLSPTFNSLDSSAIFNFSDDL